MALAGGGAFGGGGGSLVSLVSPGGRCLCRRRRRRCCLPMAIVTVCKPKTGNGDSGIPFRALKKIFVLSKKA